MKIHILYNSSYNFLLINLNHNLCSRYVWFSLFLQCSKKENIRSQWKKIILDSYTKTKGCHIIGWKWKLAAYRMKMWKKMQHTSPFCSNSIWHSVVCMTPMCLYTCLTMLEHSPKETMDVVLGNLLPRLDQDIIELLNSLRCNLGRVKWTKT